MQKPQTAYDTYKLVLFLLTIILPATAGVCLLFAILVFALASSFWWMGVLFLIAGIAALAVFWVIRGYLLQLMRYEIDKDALRLIRENRNNANAEEVPAEETPAEETPADEIPTEEVPADEVPAEDAPTEEN